MDLSIVIVNWNSVEYLRQCLASIYATTKDIEFEILVIDNASYDGCGEWVRENRPDIRFIQNDVNLGFGKANNLATEKATGKILLFLNPDTVVIDGAIERMISVLNCTPDAGIVGCRLLNKDLSVQSNAVLAFPTIWNEALDSTLLRRLFPRSRLWGNEVLLERTPCTKVVDAVAGACLLIRHDLFDKVGQFSSGYFMYVEDRDLCYKVRMAGYSTYFTNTAEVVHYGGTSSTIRPENSFETVMRCESLFSFMRERRGMLFAWVYRLVTAISAMTRMLLLGPLALLRHSTLDTGSRRDSFNKWKCVFRWSTGLSSWARKYAPERL
jgi:GT2 family glycosyltransferase